MSIILNWLLGREEAEPVQDKHDRAPALVSAAAEDIPQTRDHKVWGEIFGMGGAGVQVTEKTAMQVSAVYACISLISGTIASLPFHIYERTEDGRQKTQHDLWWLFNERPNAKYSASVFWEYLIASKIMHGDAFARIIRKNRYRPEIEGFELLHPSCVDVKTRDERLIYTIYRKDGTAQVLDQDDMIHVPNLGFDGERGLSTLRSALLQPAGIALAAGKYSEEFFANGARPDFVIAAKNSVGPEVADLIRQTWRQRHTGTGNRHLPAILQGEMEVKPLTMNAEDAQLLETRRFQTEDIARVFGVPGFLIGLTEKTTSWGSGIEHMSLGFIKFTLLAHLVKVQQEVNSKCFRTSKYFGEFNTAALERGDIKSRYEAHRIALGRAGEQPFLTRDEVRRIENLPPMKGEDKPQKGSDDE